MLASSGEMTPQTQWVTPVAKGAVDGDRVADDDAFGSDEDIFDHEA